MYFEMYAYEVNGLVHYWCYVYKDGTIEYLASEV
jgi:hypothetical protein